jgi:hypothetical protein
MLYSEIIAVCSEIHTKHINTLCGQNVVEFVNVKHGGTCSNHWDLESSQRSVYVCHGSDYCGTRTAGGAVGYI